MIELVLDTNIYRGDPSRGKAGFNAIVRLAKSDKLRLHVPYFVQGEFVSQEIEIYEQYVNSINSAILQLQRKPLPPDLVKKLEGIKEKLAEIQSDLTAFPATEFSKWVKEIRGVVHEVSNSHGAQVASDYFSGTPPFRKKKSREDIPDAFIWQAIKDLANQYDKLYVIAKDRGVISACETVSNIVTFESLDDFIQSDLCRSVLQEESVNENIQRLLKYLPVIIPSRQEDIESQLIEILEGTTIQSERLIPNSTHIATITSVDEVKQDITIDDFNSVQYYGDGVIIIPFHVQIDISANYDLSVSDYRNLSIIRSERISVSELNSLQYNAEETFTLAVAGKISVKVDTQKIFGHNLSDQDIRAMIDRAIFEVDSIDKKDVLDWDPIQNRWEYHFLDLVRYKQENGHCEVPRKHPLGQWVSNQRQRNRIGRLHKDRVERLNKLGFVWLVRPRDVLEEYIEQLLDYKKIYGHLNVPQQDKKYRLLGRWVNDQRTKKFRGTLSEEYENRLNEIGIIWNVLEATWNQRLNELKEFHEKFGHFDIPHRIKEYPKLYEWSVKLRRKRPTEERLAKLQSIGYLWDVESQRSDGVEWDEKLQTLKDYYEINGHFNVRFKENRSLYNWLFKLRSRQPSEERLEKLRNIGFRWELKTNKPKPPNWDDNLNSLKLHFETNGNFDLSYKNQPELYRWLYKLKHKKPTDEQLRKLKSIGFDWGKEIQ